MTRCPTFEKISDRVYCATTYLTSETYWGKTRIIRIEIRLDGREGEFYRIDVAKGIALWESIDGSGRVPFPRTP